MEHIRVTPLGTQGPYTEKVCAELACTAKVQDKPNAMMSWMLVGFVCL